LNRQSVLSLHREKSDETADLNLKILNMSNQIVVCFNIYICQILSFVISFTLCVQLESHKLKHISMVSVNVKFWNFMGISIGNTKQKIALCTLYVLMCSVWWENLFRETFGVHKIPHSFSYIIYWYIYSFILGVQDLLLSS
jgi:hypothetical protein